jgi:8-oxo-dGTP pyrophosphatase MutT (NUDIX family)
VSHDVALLLLCDREGRFLLQHRTADAPVMPGYWAFFGGQIDAGETPAAALRREALEELDYEPRRPALAAEVAFVEGDHVGTLFVFVEEFPGDKSRLELREGQGWGWFTVAETAGLKMVERDRRIVRLAAGFVGSAAAP